MSSYGVETREYYETLSLAWEKDEGYDSIATVTSHYESHRFTDGGYVATGTYVCVHPGCEYRLRDPLKMWGHVHFNCRSRMSTTPTLDEVKARYATSDTP